MKIKYHLQPHLHREQLDFDVILVQAASSGVARFNYGARIVCSYSRSQGTFIIHASFVFFGTTFDLCSIKMHIRAVAAKGYDR